MIIMAIWQLMESRFDYAIMQLKKIIKKIVTDQ